MGQKLHCAVCKEWSVLEHLLSFRCGHCFCTPCIASWKNAGGQQCPSCRHVIKNDNGHRIFITIGDLDIPSSDDEPSDGLSAAVVKQAKYVTKRLGRMDATASLKTVQKAEENLLKVADALETDELVEELVDAISNFKERIIPVYATLEDRQRQIKELQLRQAELQHQNKRQLQSQLLKIEALEGCQRNLQTEKMRAHFLADEAIASASKAKDETLVLRQENQKLLDERATVRKTLANEKEKDEELRKYKGFCDDYKKKESLTKAKMKGLRQENSDLKRELNRLSSRSDLDDSLRIVDRSHLIDEDTREGENMQPDFDFAVSGGSRRHPLLPKYNTRLPINHNHITDRPPAPITQADIDLDDDFCPVPTYKSDWTLSRPTKKQKTESEHAKSDLQLGRPGPSFPLKLDSKGHTRGTVQLGPRLRMGK